MGINCQGNGDVDESEAMVTHNTACKRIAHIYTTRSTLAANVMRLSACPCLAGGFFSAKVLAEGGKRRKNGYLFIYTYSFIYAKEKSSRPRLKYSSEQKRLRVIFLLVRKPPFAVSLSLSFFLSLWDVSSYSGHIDRSVFFLGGNITSISCKSLDYYVGYLFFS